MMIRRNWSALCGALFLATLCALPLVAQSPSLGPQGASEPPGILTVMPSRTILATGDGIGTLPRNLNAMASDPTVYRASWKSGGITVEAITPRLSGENPQHHAGRFFNDVAALKELFPPDPPSGG